MTDTSKTQDDRTFFADALPEADLHAAAPKSEAMPRALAKELGDYAEGDYDVAAKTRDAPTMEESNFCSTINSDEEE